MAPPVLCTQTPLSCHLGGGQVACHLHREDARDAQLHDAEQREQRIREALAQLPEVAAAKKRTSLEAMRADAESRVLTRDFVGALRAKPDLTHDDVIQSVARLTQAGMMDPQQGSQLVRMLPPTREGLLQ